MSASGLEDTIRERAARLGINIDDLSKHDRTELRKPILSKRSLIIVWQKEHNLIDLLDYVKKMGFKGSVVIATDPRKGAEKRVTKDFASAVSSYIECDAPFTEVSSAIYGSEFSAIAFVMPLPDTPPQGSV